MYPLSASTLSPKLKFWRRSCRKIIRSVIKPGRNGPFIHTMWPIRNERAISYRNPAWFILWEKYFLLNGRGSLILKSVQSTETRQSFPSSFKRRDSHFISEKGKFECH
jgi:hypothetical protein